MAAKGAAAKAAIFEKMKSVFEDSFLYNNGKELRINYMEESGPVQIKVTLTAAKDIINLTEPAAVASETEHTVTEQAAPAMKEPTLEEKQNVEALLKSLGLN